MAGYTRGPWKVDGVLVFAAEGPAICHAPWNKKLRVESETRANRKLIAAAPDLYEALRACIAELEFHAPGHSYAEIQMANKALAKAEERS